MLRKKRPSEGVLREDADQVDAEGFVAPTIGALEHALYFTNAASVSEKANQVLNSGRLLLPGVVVVWDETSGRRKGAKAIPKAWWATHGSLTVAFAFAVGTIVDSHDELTRAAAAVIRVLSSFQPRLQVSFCAPNALEIAGKRVGRISMESNSHADLIVVQLNCVTDFSKAPATISSSACRLVDFIDVKQLPLQESGTLPNTVLTRLMAEIPNEFGLDD
ncbi:hypothetical protein [Pseudoxanthomonas sacheonensis]|uniref:hypothetical protein n=1 Tax=Pseudoxanthomonas sacheonensis TaxID=443615 RepID=UPI0013D3D242|nr:hypothetical protein [Pseudoxanthomonas sacheonensis]